MNNRSAKTNVAFKLVAPKAKEVILNGSFINWRTEGLRMVQDPKGVWNAEVWLRPGHYEYKYFIDGQWVLDPDNPDKKNNGLGSQNSVIIVKAQAYKLQTGI